MTRQWGPSVHGVSWRRRRRCPRPLLHVLLADRQSTIDCFGRGRTCLCFSFAQMKGPSHRLALPDFDALDDVFKNIKNIVTRDKLSSLPDFCPRFQFGWGQFLSHSLVSEPCVLFQNGGGHRGCSANGKQVCAHPFGARSVLPTPHILELHSDATNALSLLARASTPKPRDARARNSLIAIYAAGGPRSAGIGRGPRVRPDGSSTVFRTPLPGSYLQYGVAAAFCV